MKEESLLLLSDLQKLINQVVLIDYTIIILGGKEIANLSKKQCINGLCAIGLSPQVAIAGALTYTLAKCLINKVSKFGGLATAVVAGILTWAAGQVIAFGKGLARGALNNGVRVSWNWNPFKEAVGIGITVKY